MAKTTIYERAFVLMSEKPWLRPREAAEELGVTYGTFRTSLCRKGISFYDLKKHCIREIQRERDKLKLVA